MHLSMHSELIKSVFSNARFYLELNCLIFEKVFFSYFVIWEFEETRVLFRCELSTKTPIHMNFSHLLPPWLWLCCGTLDMVESPLLYSAGLRISSILEIYCAWENLFRRIPVHFNSNILVLFLISIVKFPDLLMVTLLLKLPSGYQTMPSSGFCSNKHVDIIDIIVDIVNIYLEEVVLCKAVYLAPLERHRVAGGEVVDLHRRPRLPARPGHSRYSAVRKYISSHTRVHCPDCVTICYEVLHKRGTGLIAMTVANPLLCWPIP